MEDVGAQVAPPIYLHQGINSRFCEQPLVARKRDLSYQLPSLYRHQSQQQRHVSGIESSSENNWNPKLWNWDSVRFVAKPVNTTEVLQPGSSVSEQRKKDEGNKKAVVVTEDGETLDLNLAGGLSSLDEPVSRPNKRVRSGSPGSANYPMCQVDNCKEDLSSAKDYHRRHKVCEAHSKATKALVAKQMQRFCQQCSRFHPLAEFDEGKRSCRRRLAGHNRRRRKTQPEDVTPQLLLPGNRDNKGNGNLDILNLLTALAHAQGKDVAKSINCSPEPNREQLIQILSKLKSLPSPVDLAAKLPNIGNTDRSCTELPLALPGNQNQSNGKNTMAPSTMDLLTALSDTLVTSSPDSAKIPQRSTQSSDSEKTKSTCHDQAASPDLQIRSPLDFPSVGGEKSSSSYHSPAADSDCQMQEVRTNLPLQLFSSSPEDGSPPNLASSRKYFSSDSSNPMEDRSASSSPIVKPFFPVHSRLETAKPENMSISRDVNAIAERSRTNGSTLPLDLFSGPKRGAEQRSPQSYLHQAGYASSSGSDHSPSSLNSDAQDRTGRIIFKLFDKDPSHIPGTLRTQIFNWLSNSPSEMESYIRPGCVVLSIYVSMPSAAWEQFEGNLHQRVGLLLRDSESDFWRNARFLVHTGRQLASHKGGKIRLCKSWRTWTSPELISVSPLAIVAGQETSLVLRGKNLTNPGTKIHCAYMGGYSSKVSESTYRSGTTYEEVNVVGFKIQTSSSNTLGRCFIEVENGFKGNSFPVIIANDAICKELRLLESEFELGSGSKSCDIIPEEHAHDSDRPRSQEEVLHFLNELGWLFQRKNSSPVPETPGYSLYRFKFLLIFSVERDYCAIVKTLLDMLVERIFDMGSSLSTQSVEMLTEIHLLSRAVKRKSRKMVELLVHYSISSSNDTSGTFIFPPNLKGPGGITPLHLAASTSGSEDVIDALTNDPNEIGLSSWHSLLDSTGQSAFSYATLTNNHSYNKLVERKLSDRKNGQVTIAIETADQLNRRISSSLSVQGNNNNSSCTKCAIVATKVGRRRIPGSQTLLQRPYVHSVLAIAAVCVCVCLFFRGSPQIGSDVPFKWENLNFGTI